MPITFLTDIQAGGPSYESSRRTFRCPRDHEYMADRPMTIAAYGLTAPFALCPVCFTQLLVETCGTTEVKAAPPPPPKIENIAAPGVVPPGYKGPPPLTMAQVLELRRAAQGLTPSVPSPAPKVLPSPATTASDAPEPDEK